MYHYTHIRYESKKNYTLFYKMLFLVFDLPFFREKSLLVRRYKILLLYSEKRSISSKHVRYWPVHAYGRQRESDSKSVANSGVK